MQKLEKLCFAVGCYIEALVLNAFVAPMLDGSNLVAWIIYNVWMWIFVPPLILFANRKEKE